MKSKHKITLSLFNLIENSVPLADAVSIGETVVVLDTVVFEATAMVDD